MKTALALATAFAAGLYKRLPQDRWRRACVLLAALPLLFLLYVLVLIPFTPSIGDIRKSKSEQPAIVLSADGKELAMFKRANRDWVKLADISPNVLAALISTEDHRFYQHHGIDFKRTASAILSTLSGDREGGSTISQQLARNLYPEEIGRARTVTRKVKEAITALKIEAIYEKDEILETYLNTVPFLYNAFGIEMAARTYFDKSAARLDVLESATLIGMLKGTSYYNPVLNPERAVKRRNIVLGQMVRNGKLEQARFDTLKKRPLKVDFERQTEPLGPAPHLTQQLRRWLIDWADRNGYNIFTDGLVVRTTIDSRLQALANKAVVRQGDALQSLADARRSAWTRDMVLEFVRESPQYKAARESGTSDEDALKQLQADTAFLNSLKEDKTRIQAGFLALDPRNGQVRAWVGSREFAKDQFDHVQQARRQPGSTFKPFVYGAAFEQGARPTDTFVDQAVEIVIDRGQVWRPTDGVEPTGLSMTLREGLARSRNTITAQVMQKVGPARVAGLARAMGVRQSKLDQVPSLALGTSPVTLKEMVASYATIANGGSYVEPMVVTQVEDSKGVVLEQFQPATPEPAMSGPAALTLLDVMRGAIDQGTGIAIRARFGIRADVAGKTGTTQDNTDGWFILMHPHLVAGSWVGFNDNRVTMGDSWGQGARSALPIVGEFFQQSIRSRLVDPQVRFATPQPDAGVLGRMNEWFHGLFERPPEPPHAPEPEPAPELEALPEVAQPLPSFGTPSGEAQYPTQYPAQFPSQYGQQSPQAAAPRFAPATVAPPQPQPPVQYTPERLRVPNRGAAPSFGPMEVMRPEPGVPRAVERAEPVERAPAAAAVPAVGSPNANAPVREERSEPLEVIPAPARAAQGSPSARMEEPVESTPEPGR